MEERTDGSSAEWKRAGGMVGEEMRAAEGSEGRMLRREGGE